jgi:hypothetical protein
VLFWVTFLSPTGVVWLHHPADVSVWVLLDPIPPNHAGAGVCPGVKDALYTNITLRNITINNPKQSAGVIIANSSWPMRGVVFDNVKVNNPKTKPFPNYFCEGVEHGIATGNTSPVPPCFKDLTSTDIARQPGLL